MRVPVSQLSIKRGGPQLTSNSHVFWGSAVLLFSRIVSHRRNFGKNFRVIPVSLFRDLSTLLQSFTVDFTTSRIKLLGTPGHFR